MRICAIRRGDRSSISSRHSLSEYDIWRRWEDCLWFQDCLEQEYSRLAREKKQRLTKGKGVKKNGLYLQDRASSWESLPPGPDPNSVAQDIHEYVPRLTKKGTVFRASQATINQRNQELKALVEALFKDDLPTLLQEIRASSVVTDFFGYWRRDFDLYEAAHKSKPRSSISGSILSSPSSSNHSLTYSDLSPPRNSRLRAFTASDLPRIGSPDTLKSRFWPSKQSQDFSPSTSSLGHIASRTRALSSASSDSSSLGSDRSSEIQTLSNIPTIAGDVPVTFGHDPQRQIEHNVRDRPHSMLEVLPEDREMKVKAEPLAFMASMAVKQRRKSTVTNLQNLQPNRRAQYFGHMSPPRSPTSELTPVPEQGQEDERASPVPVRDSWMSVNSVATYLEDLKFTLPNEPACRNSVATVMTTDSADAIIKRPVSFASSSLRTPTNAFFRVHPNSNPRSRLSEAVTLSDFEIDFNDDERQAEGSEVGSLFGGEDREAFPRPVTMYDPAVEQRPEAPLSCRDTPSPEAKDRLPSCFTPLPPSPTTSIMSVSSAGASAVSSIMPDGVISIKAALNQSIILLRVQRDTRFEELRQRLYEKFVGQERVPLSKSFAVAVVRPARPAPGARRMRSGSLTSIGDRTDMVFIGSEADWERIVASHDGGKLTLRVLDTPA
ncbi:hypothetical protein AMATHDRAFT_45775 [Amanita thiersii Skay4041]|uniref:PX domain-containing protein n=1 Tax=Amanita thiersii Skay4041 TaxID=703135 RepID=A0A2A9NXL4_9AGAR|nr:hypothetical protein AMATHDRAFT_45775 [Amanita thiersii Skay4041]